MRSDERELKDLPQVEARAGYITPEKKTAGGMSAAMLAVTIACAIGAGAILTTGGQGGLGLAGWSDGFEAVMRAAGWRSPANIESEAPTSLAEIQRDIGSVATNVDALATRIDLSAKSTDQELARLKSEVGALRTVLPQTPARDKVADAAPATVLAQATATAIHNDLAALKDTADQSVSIHAAELDALLKRLNKLEVAVAASQDITGAIPANSAAAAAAPAAPPQLVTIPAARHSGRRSMRLGPGWTATEVAGNVMIRGPRGIYSAEVGAYVPGLGRIEAVREAGRLVVIGDKQRGLFNFDAHPATKQN